MTQKYCATCIKPLTPAERALSQIQCSPCYQRWLKETVAAAEPLIRAAVGSSSKPGTNDNKG
jgi:hypothetical protein